MFCTELFRRPNWVTVGVWFNYRCMFGLERFGDSGKLLVLAIGLFRVEN